MSDSVSTPPRGRLQEAGRRRRRVRSNRRSMPDARIRATSASGSFEGERLVRRRSARAARASRTRTSSIADRAVSPMTASASCARSGSVADDVPRAVRLRGHHRPRVGDQVVHVGGDPAALLLLLVEVAQPPALDRLAGSRRPAPARPGGAATAGTRRSTSPAPPRPSARRRPTLANSRPLVGRVVRLASRTTPRRRPRPATAHARPSRRSAEVAVAAERPEQRHVRRARHHRDVAAGDLHDGRDHGQSGHRDRCQPAHRERGAEQHRRQAVQGTAAAAGGRRARRTPHPTPTSSSTRRRLSPPASPHRSAVTVMGRVWPTPARNWVAAGAVVLPACEA